MGRRKSLFASSSRNNWLGANMIWRQLAKCSINLSQNAEKTATISTTMDTPNLSRRPASRTK